MELGRAILSHDVCETVPREPQKGEDYRRSWPTRAEARARSLSTSRAGTTRDVGTRRWATLPPTEFERHYTELARLALETPIFARRIGRVDSAEGLTRAYNATRLNRRGVDPLPAPGSLPKRPRRPNRSRSGGDGRQSRDERQRVASPTRSPGASSLIQQSTTTAKTCRPNRGRSIANGHAIAIVAKRSRTPTSSDASYVADAVVGVPAGRPPANAIPVLNLVARRGRRFA